MTKRPVGEAASSALLVLVNAALQYFGLGLGRPSANRSPVIVSTSAEVCNNTLNPVR